MSFRQRTIDPLAELELFAGCTPTEILRARQLLTLITVEPGTVLMEEGRYGMEFLIIASGTAAVSIGGHDVATLGSGDFVGEMSLLERGRRSATVTAVTPLACYVANAAEFTALLEAAPGVGERIVRTADARREVNRQLAA
jgi:CRP-like cAMP-binding protein